MKIAMVDILLECQCQTLPTVKDAKYGYGIRSDFERNEYTAFKSHYAQTCSQIFAFGSALR